MRSLVSFILPLIFLCCSCSKDETAPTVDIPVCLLMESTSTLTYASGSPKPQTITTRLDYNKRNALGTIFQTEYAGFYHDRADLKYNKKGQVTEVVHQYNRYVNEYNGQGKLARQTKFSKRVDDRKEIQMGYYTLRYNDQQDLAEAHYFDTTSGTPVALLVWRYTYVGGNPVALAMLEPGGESYYHAEMTYDTHNQPSVPLAHTYFEPLRPPAVHNRLSYTVREKNMGYVSLTTSYTYNAAGFPETSITRHSEGIEEITAYTYQCRTL